MTDCFVVYESDGHAYGVGMAHTQPLLRLPAAMRGEFRPHRVPVGSPTKRSILIIERTHASWC